MLKLCKGVFKSLILIKKHNPLLVAGFGGYVSFPVLISAKFLGVPSIIHEQNVIPGRANRILSRFVSSIALSFEEAGRYFRFSRNIGFIERVMQFCLFSGHSAEDTFLSKLVITGNPVRKKTEGLSAEDARLSLALEPDRFTILVMGGSQGSHRINEVFIQTLSGLTSQIQSRLQVIHLTGEKEFDKIKSDYLRLKVKVNVNPFLKQMEKVYCAADLVICRAGASCLTELSYYGCAAILVPYPYAYSHQLENAKYFSERGAGLMLRQAELTAGNLRKLIVDLMNNPKRRQTLSVNIKKLACPDAGQKLAGEIVRLIDKELKN